MGFRLHIFHHHVVLSAVLSALFSAGKHGRSRGCVGCGCPVSLKTCSRCFKKYCIHLVSP